MKLGQLRGVAVLIWLLNVVIGLGVAAFWFNGSPATGREESVILQETALAPDQPRLTVEATRTPIPPPTQRATITPFPSPTFGPSVTPMPQAPTNERVIGFSVDGRPIRVYRFGRGERVKLIVAGIHGGYEWNTVALADQLIDYLNSQPQVVPADTTLYIVRVLNPDGYARARDVTGRGNANGVDLNHNWPYRWEASYGTDGCWKFRELTGGSAPGSEPEVSALITFIDKVKPEALISYHSAALGIFSGGIPEFEPSVRLARAVAQVTDYDYPSSQALCKFSGNLADWAANTRSIPTIDIELKNHTDTDFDQNLRALQAFLNWRP